MGKSAITRELAAALGVEAPWVASKRELLRLNARAFARSPLRFVRRTSRALRGSGGAGVVVYKLRHVFLLRNAVVELARSLPSGAVVDEGHVGNVLSAWEEPLSEARLRRELRLLDLPDVLVHVRVGEAERSRRLVARGRPARAGLPADAAARWDAAMGVNDELVARLAPELPLVYVAVDGERPVAESVALVLDRLRL